MVTMGQWVNLAGILFELGGLATFLFMYRKSIEENPLGDYPMVGSREHIEAELYVEERNNAHIQGALVLLGLTLQAWAVFLP